MANRRYDDPIASRLLSAGRHSEGEQFSLVLMVAILLNLGRCQKAGLSQMCVMSLQMGKRMQEVRCPQVASFQRGRTKKLTVNRNSSRFLWNESGTGTLVPFRVGFLMLTSET